MSASRTARERARAELAREIKEEARRRLAVSGAQGLSLRAVARELGMASSALYRYFASRDELLTALIIDAYDAIADEVETAERSVPRPEVRVRWRAACRAVRAWALAHPHEYALVYGSPVPGYRAPETTIAPAGRVPAVLAGVVRDAWAANAPAAPRDEPALPPVLVAQAGRIADAIAPDVPAGAVLRIAMAWTQLFGMVTFELFGQYANTLDPADAFFEHTVARMADMLGLP